MTKIIPTIFAHNEKEFRERFIKILPTSKNIQIDFMDGKFVKSKSLLPEKIPSLKKFNKNFEAHLMTKNPEKYLSTLKRKGFKKVIFHFQNSLDVESITKKIRSLKMSPWLAFNPEVSIKRIIPNLKKTNGILLMGVHPGKENQKLIPSTIKKIQALKKLDKSLKIQIDGGVNDKTVSSLAKAGADYLNSGSFISNAKNPKEAMRKLEMSIK